MSPRPRAQGPEGYHSWRSAGGRPGKWSDYFWALVWLLGLIAAVVVLATLFKK